MREGLGGRGPGTLRKSSGQAAKEEEERQEGRGEAAMVPGVSCVARRTSAEAQGCRAEVQGMDRGVRASHQVPDMNRDLCWKDLGRGHETKVST